MIDLAGEARVGFRFSERPTFEHFTLVLEPVGDRSKFCREKRVDNRCQKDRGGQRIKWVRTDPSEQLCTKVGHPAIPVALDRRGKITDRIFMDGRPRNRRQ